MEMIIKLNAYAYIPKTIKISSSFDEIISCLNANSGYALVEELNSPSLVGIITDGDIRKYISKYSIAELALVKANDFCGRKYLSIQSSEVQSYIRKVLKCEDTNSYNVKHMPVVNSDNHLLYCIVKSKILNAFPRSVYDVIIVDDVEK